MERRTWPLAPACSRRIQTFSFHPENASPNSRRDNSSDASKKVDDTTGASCRQHCCRWILRFVGNTVLGESYDLACHKTKKEASSLTPWCPQLVEMYVGREFKCCGLGLQTKFTQHSVTIKLKTQKHENVMQLQNIFCNKKVHSTTWKWGRISKTDINVSAKGCSFFCWCFLQAQVMGWWVLRIHTCVINDLYCLVLRPSLGLPIVICM
jgi:hypothetical protein